MKIKGWKYGKLKDKQDIRGFLMKYPDVTVCLHLSWTLRGTAEHNWPWQINRAEEIASFQFKSSKINNRLYGRKDTAFSNENEAVFFLFSPDSSFKSSVLLKQSLCILLCGRCGPVMVKRKKNLNKCSLQGKYWQLLTLRTDRGDRRTAAYSNWNMMHRCSIKLHKGGSNKAVGVDDSLVFTDASSCVFLSISVNSSGSLSWCHFVVFFEGAEDYRNRTKVTLKQCPDWGLNLEYSIVFLIFIFT